MRWLPRRANFHAESADRASPLTHGAGKLEILGMFPPRTEAPTADKLTFCYAPHVDMATVIEVEVRRTPVSFIASFLPPSLSPEYLSITSAAQLRTITCTFLLKQTPHEIKPGGHFVICMCAFTCTDLRERFSMCYRNVSAVVARIWVKVRKCMRQLPLHYDDYADTPVTYF